MDRPEYIKRISFAFQVHPVVTILGPRQCGKTTLARMFARTREQNSVTHFDLEDPTHLARLNSPKLALQDLHGLVIIDEVQRTPGIFEVLRVLVDREQNRARFLILGSASRDLIKQSSETLAGRIGHLELTPFSLTEVGTGNIKALWRRGGYPPSYLANSEDISTAWRDAYISTFLEQDIPSLGISIPPVSLRRFWMMLAHYHGQLINYSEIGRSFGASDQTIRRYLDLLEATFMVRQLAPWYENIKKRQVKSPKIYIRDSGLFHSLLGINDSQALDFHPKLGPSWEGFAIEEIIRKHLARESECFFWSTHGRAELDLLIVKDGRRLGFEVKYTDSPRATKSMITALRDLKLDELIVVYPGDETFPLMSGIRAIGLPQLLIE